MSVVFSSSIYFVWPTLKRHVQQKISLKQNQWLASIVHNTKKWHFALNPTQRAFLNSFLFTVIFKGLEKF